MQINILVHCHWTFGRLDATKLLFAAIKVWRHGNNTHVDQIDVVSYMKLKFGQTRRGSYIDIRPFLCLIHPQCSGGGICFNDWTNFMIKFYSIIILILFSFVKLHKIKSNISWFHYDQVMFFLLVDLIAICLFSNHIIFRFSSTVLLWVTFS